MGVITYLIHLGLDLLIGGRVIPTVIAILIAVMVYAVLILKLGAMSEEDILALPMGARDLKRMPETASDAGSHGYLRSPGKG